MTPVSKTLLDKMILQSRNQIMAYEDEAIFDAIDALDPTPICRNRSHEAFGRSITDCSDVDCVVKSIHES